MSRVFYFSVCWLLVNMSVKAQQGTDILDMHTEETIEWLPSGDEEESDFSSLFEDREYWLVHPLNLNEVTADQLAQLCILNDFQIAAILCQREKGDFLSIYELLYIPGIREKDVLLLNPFITCRPPRKERVPAKDFGDKVDHQLLLRWQRILEEQEGYTDSVVPERQVYPGSPDKFLLRYRLEMGDNLQAGILMEKDPGEDFFRGSNPQGFDLYSGFISFAAPNAFLRQAIAGDYHVSVGQGLILGRPGYYGKPAGGIPVKTGPVLKGKLSADENDFFRGVALTAGKGNLSFTCFGSLKRVDASPRGEGEPADSFFTLINTGLHNTPSAMEQENFLNEGVAGASLRYDRNRLHMGLSGFCQQYDKYCTKSDRLYDIFSFNGKNYHAASLDYRYLAGKMQLFGETAYSCQAFSFLGGAVVYVNPGINVTLLYRNYDESYYSSWAEAFSEGGEVNNEEGYYIGLGAVSGSHQWNFYADFFSFPWLCYRVNEPSEGYEIASSWDVNIGNLSLCLRVRREVKPVNTASGGALKVIVPKARENYKLRAVYPLGDRFSLQGRMEITRSQLKGDTSCLGYLVCGDFQLIPWERRLSLSGRVAWFFAPEYDARLYAWEKDVPASAVTQMLYGRGWRLMFLARWDISPDIHCWCKLSRTWYPGETAIGSGMNTISGDHRTEVKLQLVVDLGN